MDARGGISWLPRRFLWRSLAFLYRLSSWAFAPLSVSSDASDPNPFVSRTCHTDFG